MLENLIYSLALIREVLVWKHMAQSYWFSDVLLYKFSVIYANGLLDKTIVRFVRPKACLSLV